MSTILFSAFAFVITISFLVFIHEYGHFWVARRLGVRIEKFSIGFGKPIVKWHGKRDNTEYSLSWIPLGGYVKMYGENPGESGHAAADLSGDYPMQDNFDGSFSALPPFKRLLIALAGPAVNLLFAVLALWVLFLIGVPAYKPTIGSIRADSPLVAAQINPGDTIVAVNGRETGGMGDAAISLVEALGGKSVPLVAEDKNGRQKTARLDLSDYKAGQEMKVEQLAGFTWAIAEVTQNAPAVIDSVGEGTPADKAGLKPGDKVVQVDGKPIAGWQGFVDAVSSQPDKTLKVVVARQGKTAALTLTTGRHPKDKTRGYAGVSPKIDRSMFTPFYTVKRYGLWEALPKAVAANYLQAELMLKTLWRLAAGKASLENLGGPLSIADYSGQSLSAGYVTYFHFLACPSA